MCSRSLRGPCPVSVTSVCPRLDIFRCDLARRKAENQSRFEFPSKIWRTSSTNSSRWQPCTRTCHEEESDQAGSASSRVPWKRRQRICPGYRKPKFADAIRGFRAGKKTLPEITIRPSKQNSLEV